MEQVNKPKYPTFQDKYGQLAPQDQTFEQNRAPEEDKSTPALNPWSTVMQENNQPQEEIPEVQLAPRQWEYSGK